MINLFRSHRSEPIQACLELCLEKLSKENGRSVPELTTDFHIWPDYHGNRAPLADPNMKGMICGLTLEKTEDNLALCYLAAIQAVAYGTKAIVEQIKQYSDR